MRPNLKVFRLTIERQRVTEVPLKQYGSLCGRNQLSVTNESVWRFSSKKTKGLNVYSPKKDKNTIVH